MISRLLLRLAAVFGLSLMGSGAALAAPATAPVDANAKAAMECAALKTTDFTQIEGAATSVTTAEIVPASGGTKEYCRVVGYVQPQIGFELRLPTQSWNGRYFQVGCGGLCGVINIQNCGDALAKDFAVAANNMGHVGDFWKEPIWGSDPQLRQDYGKRSTHAMAVASKAIIAAYYGAKPAYSYFRGCSTGGREGLSEAQHFPGDFNGIIAGDPAFPGRLGALANNWDANHLLDANHKPVLSEAKLQLLHTAVINACDAIDGLKDGILMDPRDCHYDYKKLSCPKGGEGATCLSAAELVAVEALYTGVHNSKGQRLSPGASPYGSELAWDGNNRRAIADAYLRYLAFADQRPTMSYRDFDFDKDPELIAAQSAIYDPVAPGTAPDLAAFHAAGGKLIAYHGWSDPGVPPESLLDYYAKVTGKQGGVAEVRNWFRVFMVPGMLHCRGGDAPNTFDFLAPMMAWVEKGIVPDGVVATQFEADKKTVKRTRPLFAYPTFAAYKGKGDVNDAANWGVKSPKTVRDDNIDWLWAPKN
jgi:hypothetical protein